MNSNLRLPLLAGWLAISVVSYHIAGYLKSLRLDSVKSVLPDTELLTGPEIVLKSLAIPNLTLAGNGITVGAILPLNMSEYLRGGKANAGVIDLICKEFHCLAAVISCVCCRFASCPTSFLIPYLLEHQVKVCDISGTARGMEI